MICQEQIEANKVALPPECPLCHGKGTACEVDAILPNGELVNPRIAVCMVCNGLGAAWPDRS